ncbi:MAG: polyphosphate kinase 2 family protein [Gammaproteobacteria bacterium]|nr:polyphosphate kinase 2 family protein [Gammaproteobacteria bacterium]
MDFEQFHYSPGNSLSDFKTLFDGGMDRDQLKDLRAESWEQLADYQERLYAESRQSLLIVLQAMDAAGKDSTIAKLTRGLNAQGCHVHSFKKPTARELAHDFLWRVHDKAPAAGSIALFNRSHYEDVLIVKVHGWASASKIRARYDHINNFEALLADRGTRVIKFMLNISQDYQLERFKQRLENREKNWKFNPGDLDERALWGEYMKAFEAAMSNCSTAQAPWYVVPAENRRYRDLMISTLILNALQEMDPQHPAPDFDPLKYTVDSIR